MSWLTQTMTSSVGRKLIMGLTGLFLLVFLVMHLAGNLLLFNQDPEPFTKYAEFMSTNGIIRVMEVVLVLGFLLHIISGIMLTMKNRQARPQGYKKSAAGANSSISSRTMAFTGSLIFIFLIVHINSFVVKHRIIGTEDTMYHTVIDAFQYGWGGFYWLFYVAAMILLAFHLNHGFQSAFQTLGLNHKKYTPFIKGLGLIYSIVVPAGYAAIPVYHYLQTVM